MELSFPFELKEVSEKGEFTGLASTYSNVDRGGDIVAPGAFSRTLKENGAERPILWSHDVTQPVGLGTLSDSDAGLLISGKLDLDVQAGREAYSRLKKRIVKGLSIGYKTITDKVEENVRRLLDVELFEVSLVLFPMNSAATVQRVKSDVQTVRDFERFLHQAGWSKSEATRLASHGWPGLAPDPGADAVLAWLKTQNAGLRA